MSRAGKADILSQVSRAASRRPSTAIVGAGIAGPAAARALARRGVEAVVYDKGRSPGGRTSTRRSEPFAFDHGAQYFTARESGFRDLVEHWLSLEVVARWDGEIVSLRDGNVRPGRDRTERFVGVPRMSALASFLSQGARVHAGVRVTQVERSSGRWRLRDPSGAPLGEFEQLIVTAPPQQAAALIGESSYLGARASEIVMQPCWAVMLGLAERYAVRFDGAFCDDTVLSWIARDSSKPGRGENEAWVLHASPTWSEANGNASSAEVSASLIAALERATGLPLPEIVHRDAHRWRFAAPQRGLDAGALVDEGRRLALAGDAYCGGRVEGAYLSGLAAAERLLAGRSNRGSVPRA